MSKASLAQSLLSWFGRHARQLPWRATRDPYAIWISEVMLQQTQVATVIPYFETFLSQFPDVAALAAACEHDVLKLWEGLGYYRRARSLHAAARIVCQEHAGQLPRNPLVLRRLPGLGRYTANAILSQAFDQRLPILEANSRRVLCRYLGKKRAVDNELWREAEKLLPARRVGQFNQALMELGALVCTPKKPGCGRCPVRAGCTARHAGVQEQIPMQAAKPKPVDVAEVALLVRRGPKVLLVRRPASGRWANMWEFPHVEQLGGETAEQSGDRLAAGLGLRVTKVGHWTTIRHAVTRFRITLTCLEAVYHGGRFRKALYPEGQWVVPGDLETFAISSPQRRLARLLSADAS